MRKSIFLTVLIIAVIVTTFLVYNNSNPASSDVEKFIDQTNSSSKKKETVPIEIDSIILVDQQKNNIEISMDNSPFTAFIVAEPSCQACEYFLEDFYKSVDDFTKEKIDTHFVWIDVQNNTDDFAERVHSKVSKYTDNISNHYLYAKNDFEALGFKVSAFPIIAIYNQKGALMFEVPGYSEIVIEEMLKVADLKSPFIIK